MSQHKPGYLASKRFLPLLVTQFLGSRGVVPDTGLGQFQFYLGQALLAIGEVKDTP